MSLNNSVIAEQYTLHFMSSWGVLVTDGLGVVKKAECDFLSINYKPTTHTNKVIVNDVDEVIDYIYSDLETNFKEIDILAKCVIDYSELELVNYLRGVVSVNLKRLKKDADRFKLPYLVDTEEIMFVELNMFDGTTIEPDYSLLKNKFI